MFAGFSNGTSERILNSLESVYLCCIQMHIDGYIRKEKLKEREQRWYRKEKLKERELHWYRRVCRECVCRCRRVNYRPTSCILLLLVLQIELMI